MNAALRESVTPGVFCSSFELVVARTGDCVRLFETRDFCVHFTDQHIRLLTVFTIYQNSSSGILFFLSFFL